MPKLTEKSRILILSRKYPPSIGGMQAYTWNFVRNMENLCQVDKIVLGGEQINLVWFIPYLFIKSATMIAARKYDLVYICDGLLAPVGLILKKLFGVKTAVTVHGLDITYGNPLYQKIVPSSIAKLDKVICVSGNTLEECIKKGIPRQKCRVITNGVEGGELKVDLSDEERIKRLEKVVGERVEGKKILITVGRLIKRKGVGWFTSNVMPQLDDKHLYLIAGEGSEKDNIARVIEENDMSGRVKLLGKVSYDALKLLYNSADAMVIPNQRIAQDAEGFGIVAIEAASCGVPVIANSIDGLKEAVLDGRTGWLVEYNDIKQFKDRIQNPRLERTSVREASEVFLWSNIIKEYQEVIDEI